MDGVIASEPKNDGWEKLMKVDVECGQAFPSATEHYTAYGMTLRDWLAGQALAGLCSRATSSGAPEQIREQARWAYEVADAMVAARRPQRPKVLG